MSKKKYYPMRVPRSASGIRAQDARGSGARSWWAKRWLSRLNELGLGARLGRGRNYALSGQVLSVAINGSHVEATILGTRPNPYRVTVDFREPKGASRTRIVNRLKGEAMIIARLLVNELPTEAELFFQDEGLDLFPGGRLEDNPKDPPGRRRYDMTTKCSCPDYANPCKHSTAVLLLLGEEIARRPSLLLELRGISMKELCDEN